MTSFTLQILILITGVGAILLLGRGTYKPRIIGCIFGLISQVFWLLFYLHMQSIGENVNIMYLITITYTITWIINMKRIIKNKGIENEREKQKRI